MQTKTSFPFLFLLFSLAALLFSCTTKNKNVEFKSEQTITFSRYLHLNFGDSIPEGKHVFILVSKRGKPDCNKTLGTLRTALSGKSINTYSIIASSDVHLCDSLLPETFLHTDWDGAIDRLDLPLGNVSLVQTENGEVKTIDVVDADNAQQMASLFSADE